MVFTKAVRENHFLLKVDYTFPGWFLYLRMSRTIYFIKFYFKQTLINSNSSQPFPSWVCMRRSILFHTSKHIHCHIVWTLLHRTFRTHHEVQPCILTDIYDCLPQVSDICWNIPSFVNSEFFPASFKCLIASAVYWTLFNKVNNRLCPTEYPQSSTPWLRTVLPHLLKRRYSQKMHVSL